MDSTLLIGSPRLKIRCILGRYRGIGEYGGSQWPPSVPRRSADLTFWRSAAPYGLTLSGGSVIMAL